MAPSKQERHRAMKELVASKKEKEEKKEERKKKVH